MKSLLTWNMQKYGFLSIEEQTEGAKSRKKWRRHFLDFITLGAT